MTKMGFVEIFFCKTKLTVHYLKLNEMLTYDSSLNWLNIWQWLQKLVDIGTFDGHISSSERIMNTQ